MNQKWPARVDARASRDRPLTLPMSKPHPKNYPRTMFLVEGNTVAVLVTHGRRLTSRHITMRSPEDALAWCRRNRARFIYLPEDFSHN